jgi:hypothetical protein
MGGEGLFGVRKTGLKTPVREVVISCGNSSQEKTAVVEIRSHTDCIAPDSIRVHTYPKPNDEKVRLAIIERRTDGFTSATISRPPTFHILVDREEMSHEDAMKRAEDFAQQYGIPVICEQKD